MSASAAAPLPAPPPPDPSAPTIDDVARDLKRSPFFMTSADDINAAMASDAPNPDLEAIRALMHEGSRWEVAEGFRASGNELARARRWEDARGFYDKAVVALEGKPGDVDRRDEHIAARNNDRGGGDAGAEEGTAHTTEEEIDAELEKETFCLLRCLANRALCNLELHNYRRVTSDCTDALRMSSFLGSSTAVTSLSAKVHYRLALAYLHLSSLDLAEKQASIGTRLAPSDTAFPTLQAGIKAARRSSARAASSRESLAAARKFSNQLLDAELDFRNIHTRWTAVSNSASQSTTDSSKTIQARLASAKEAAHWNADGGVHMPDGALIVPVVLLYPRAHRSDVIARVAEQQTLAEVLAQVLPLPWDVRGEYVAGGVQAFVERAGDETKEKEEKEKKALMRWGGKIEVRKVLVGGELVDGALRVFVLPKTEAKAWVEEWKKGEGGR